MSKKDVLKKQAYLKALVDTYKSEKGLLFPFGLWEIVRQVKNSQFIIEEDQGVVKKLIQLRDEKLLFEWTNDDSSLDFHEDLFARLSEAIVREGHESLFLDHGFEVKEKWHKYSWTPIKFSNRELPEEFMLKNVAPTNEAKILAAFLSKEAEVAITEDKISSWTLRHVYDLNGWLWFIDRRGEMKPGGVLLAEFDEHSDELHVRWFVMKPEYRSVEFYEAMFQRVISEFPKAKLVTLTLPENHFLMESSILSSMGFKDKKAWFKLVKK